MAPEMDRLGETTAAWELVHRVGSWLRTHEESVSDILAFTPKATPESAVAAKQPHDERT